jgi:hypothetical protein
VKPDQPISMSGGAEPLTTVMYDSRPVSHRQLDELVQ